MLVSTSIQGGQLETKLSSLAVEGELTVAAR